MTKKTNWAKLQSMSDDDIEQGINQDPDTMAPTKKELQTFKRVNPVKSVNIKKIRERLDLSQSKFALYFGVSTRTIQEWEQGRSRPNQLARNFLKVVEYNPLVVQEALKIEE